MLLDTYKRQSSNYKRSETEKYILEFFCTLNIFSNLPACNLYQLPRRIVQYFLRPHETAPANLQRGRQSENDKISPSATKISVLELKLGRETF